jgi:hypothetical protein
MLRLSAAAVLALATVAVWSPGAAESALTPRNSVVAPLVVTEEIGIEGVGCGVPASATVTLPAGVSDVRVKRPSVGARSLDAQLTNVSVQGNAVTFTAVADGAPVCDPNEEATPPANRRWSEVLDAEVGYKLRVGVASVRDQFETRGKVLRVRPRRVQIGISAAARGIRWKQFGGLKAVGFGTFKSLTPCPGGCTDNGTRLRVELTRPAHCPGLEPVFYSKVAFVLRERLGILRPGREWISDKLTSCPIGPGPLIRVR